METTNEPFDALNRELIGQSIGQWALSNTYIDHGDDDAYSANYYFR